MTEGSGSGREILDTRLQRWRPNASISFAARRHASVMVTTRVSDKIAQKGAEGVFEPQVDVDQSWCCARLEA